MTSINTTINKSIFRRELYMLIWKTPITTLAKKHNISADTIRSICKNLEIPTPTSGYWSKLKFNKKVEIPPLPKIKNDNKETGLKFIDGKLIYEEHFQTAFYRIKKEIETSNILLTKTSEKLSKPHPLIKIAKTDLKSKKPNTYLYSKIKETISTSKNIISIDVSKENVHKALCFMDALLKLLKIRNHIVEINGYHTEVIIFNERITIRCREILKRIKVKDPDSRFNWEHSELVPSGIIAFEIGESYWKRDWRETKIKPLETKLSNIIASLELKAQKIKEERIENEKRQREYEKQRKIKEERRKKFENEVAKFNQLKENAKRWDETQQLRVYIQAVETNAIKNQTLTEELKTWIIWANNKVDWYDPIIKKSDDFFTNASN